MNAQAYQNTDKLLHETNPDNFYENDQLFLTVGGGIKMQSGGFACSRTIKDWIEIVKRHESLSQEIEQLKAQLAELSVDFRVLENNYESALAKLEKAIVPKFKIGQEVWYRQAKETNQVLIEGWQLINSDLSILIIIGGFKRRWVRELSLFATREEAEASLNQKEGE